MTHSLSGAALARSLHVCARLDLVYVNNPKVACSTLKLALQRAQLDDPGYTPPVSVHDHDTSPLLTGKRLAGQALSALEGRFVFSFVRNPYDRLKSAYLNKIVRPQKQGGFRSQAGFDPSQCPAFEDFVLAVCAQTPEKQNPHWRLQARNLSIDSIRYDMIGRLESFDTHWSRLADQFALPRKPDFAGKRTASAAKTDLTFTPAMQQAVNHAYAADFEAFNYPANPPRE